MKSQAMGAGVEFGGLVDSFLNQFKLQWLVAAIR